MMRPFLLIYESVILESILSDIDSLDIPADIKNILKDHNGKTDIKGQKAALNWISKDLFEFPQDKMLMLDGISLLSSKIQNYENIKSKSQLEEIVNGNKLRLADKAAKKEARAFDPAKEPTFSNPYDAGDGVIIYQVEDSKAGQIAVRKAVDKSWRG